jgi:hypothetical protein
VADDGGSESETALVVDLAGNAGVSGLLNPFAVPMLSVHGVVAGGLSIGGTLGFVSASPESSGSRDSSIQSVTVGPRIGGVVPFGAKSKWGIWIKGGITYTSLSVETTTVVQCLSPPCTPTTTSSSSSTTWFDITLDPMFMYFPIPHVGLLFGPALDIGVASSESRGSSSGDGVKYSSYGVAAGLAVFL